MHKRLIGRKNRKNKLFCRMSVFFIDKDYCTSYNELEGVNSGYIVENFPWNKMEEIRKNRTGSLVSKRGGGKELISSSMFVESFANKDLYFYY